MIIWETSVEQRNRRWKNECDYGRKHSQLDVFQHRSMWVAGEVHDLVLCSWCGTWAKLRGDDDLPEHWSEETKRYWRSHHS